MQGAWVQSLLRELDPPCHNFRSHMQQQGLTISCAMLKAQHSQKNKYFFKNKEKEASQVWLKHTISIPLTASRGQYYSKSCVYYWKPTFSMYLSTETARNRNWILHCPQFSSIAQSCLTLCDPMNRSMPGLPIHHQLLEFTQTHAHPAISSFVVPFSSCPQSLPASGSFPMSRLFSWGGQSIGVSALASVLPKNTQDWSPLGWTSWISLQSKGLSRIFSNTTVWTHQFFGTQLSSQSNSHIHTWPLEKPEPWLHGPLLAK